MSEARNSRGSFVGEQAVKLVGQPIARQRDTLASHGQGFILMPGLVVFGGVLTWWRRRLIR